MKEKNGNNLNFLKKVIGEKTRIWQQYIKKLNFLKFWLKEIFLFQIQKIEGSVLNRKIENAYLIF